MDTLTTATGKTFDCDYFNPDPAGDQVNFRILGESLVNVAKTFGSAAETVQLFCGGKYLANHTKVIAIIPEVDAIRVVLGKE